MLFRLKVRGELGRIVNKPVREPRSGYTQPIPSKGALPDHSYPPARLTEPSVTLLVPCDGRRELGFPEVHTSLRRCRVFASRMLVPEAAVDKADRAVLGEDEIRFPGQTLPMEPVPETTRMECLAQ